MVEKDIDGTSLITVQVSMPKVLYNFMMGFAKMMNLEPDEFMYSAIMYCIERLSEERKSEDISYIRS